MSAITTVRNNFLEEFPEEVNHLILSGLDAQELGRVCQVCKAGDRLASDDKLWKKFFSWFQGQGVKNKIGSHAVRSFDEILQYFQIFLDRIQLSQTGLFACEFPLNPGCQIKAHFLSNAPSTKEFDHKEHRVFIKSLPVRGLYLAGNAFYSTGVGGNGITYLGEHRYPVLLDEQSFSQGRMPSEVFDILVSQRFAQLKIQLDKTERK